MNPNVKSDYLYEKSDGGESCAPIPEGGKKAEISEQLKPNSSQYALDELNKSPLKRNAGIVQKVDSEYLLRDLRQQDDQNQVYSRDAPSRPFLIGTPVNAKEIRAQIESLDNAIVIPQILDGKVYFTTHGDADARTAVEGNASSPRENSGVLQNEGMDLHKLRFTFEQIVSLLGPSTGQRLQREMAKRSRLSEAELAQLNTARESLSEPSVATGRSSRTLRTAQSVEPNLLSTRTANSVEPNLLSVYSAISPGMLTENEDIFTAQSREPNLLSVRTANSLEPNLLSVMSAKDLTTMTASPGVLTAVSVGTARSASNSSLSGKESQDVQTCIEIQSPTTGVLTALSFPYTSTSSQSVFAVNEVESVRSSKDVATAVEILSDLSRSSQDVRTAIEIQESGASRMTA